MPCPYLPPCPNSALSRVLGLYSEGPEVWQMHSISMLQTKSQLVESTSGNEIAQADFSLLWGLLSSQGGESDSVLLRKVSARLISRR